jgi:hypothetical protein
MQSLWLKHNDPSVVQAMLQYVRENGDVGQYLEYCANTLCPPPCKAHGRKGLFISGSETFCRKCKEEGLMNPSMRQYQQRYEKKAIEAGRKSAEFERDQKRRDTSKKRFVTHYR